jgi:tetratricopeptide (TPR) repeat protein
MKKQYSQALGQILEGHLGSVSQEIHELRFQQNSSDGQIERSLLAIRLAMKAGNFLESPENLRVEHTQSVFLKAEIHFVQGTYFAMTSRHAEAVYAYARAAQNYEKALKPERQALSLFNELIACSYASDLNLEAEQVQLGKILNICREHNISNVEFLCQRHQAYRAYEKESYQESIELLLPWVARKETLTKSDSELALLHIADCFWELRDLRQALHYFDQVPALHDERVRFPKALIEAKIWQKDIDIHAFSFVTDHWRSRFEKFCPSGSAAKLKMLKPKGLMWNQATGVLAKGSRLQGKIKPNTLEGHLLRLLMDAPRSKAYLCESLWPAEMEVFFLMDRFHQMIQRIQRKTNGLIEFDGQSYRLKESLKAI